MVQFVLCNDKLMTDFQKNYSRALGTALAIQQHSQTALTNRR